MSFGGAETLHESVSCAYYLIREKLWRTLIGHCKDSERKFGDPFFVFWKAYGLYREGNPSQALTELQKIESKKELQWATCKASIWYHSKCKNVDNNAVDSQRYLERDLAKNPSERAVVAAAYFEMFNGDSEGAYEILQSTRYDSPIVLIARGWCDVFFKDENSLDRAKQYFDQAIQIDQKNTEAYFGLARLGENSRKQAISQNAVNDILSINPDFVPGLLEKCRLGISKKDYPLVKEGFLEVLKVDKTNLLGSLYRIFYLLAFEGNLDEAREKFEKLCELIKAQEPENSEFMLFVVSLISKICGRATVILNLCLRLIERCRQLDMMSILPQLELGTIHFMMEDYGQSFNAFKMAASLNMETTEIRPIVGIIKTQIAKNEILEAELQLKFLKETAGEDATKTPDFFLVEAMISARKPVDKKDISAFEASLQETNRILDDALKCHMAVQRKIPLNIDYYMALNPDFLLTLANEMLYHSDFNLTQIIEKIQNPITPTHMINKAVKLLETTLARLPGLIPGYMLSAKANLIVGNTTAAMSNLQKTIQLDPKNEDAYILNAIVVYSNGNTQDAYASIREALANNFEMDKNPFFMMIKGRLEIELKDTVAGLKTLEKAFNLPGIKDASVAEIKKKSRYMTIIQFNQNIRSQTFVEYAKALAQDKQLSKSKEIMEEAIMEFAGTDDEPVVLLGNADIAAASGDLKKALSILKAVEPEAKGYMEARKKMAEIFLHKMMNRRQYAKCYYDLVQVFPNFDNYKRYGDALLEIQEPDKAIDAYNEALKIDPKNLHIVRLIGKALSITHNYQRAVDYYEENVMKFPKSRELKLDHVKMLVKNNFFDKVEEMLDLNELMKGDDEPNLESIKYQIEGLLEFTTIFRKKLDVGLDNDAAVVTNLQEIWKRILELQLDVIERARYEGGKPEVEKIKYSHYCQMVGDLNLELEPKPDAAKSYFEEALKYNPNKTEINLDLAEVDFLNGDALEAEVKCTKILKFAPGHPWALKLFAECLISQAEIEKGVAGFERIYARDPTNFIALGCLFEFYRRDGQLNKIKDELNALEQKLGKSNEPGYCYVRGLYYFYRKNPNEALVNLFQAKRHHLYKNHAIKVMLDIYLNPDQDLLFTAAGEKAKPIRDENIKAMEKIVEQLTDKYYGLEQQIWATYVNGLLQKKWTECEQFLDQTIKENEGCIPAMIAFLVLRLNKGGKGALDKNVLKNISKSKFNAKWGDDNERGWIQVADFLGANDRVELAEKELHRCLKYNKSCAKAYELLGSIAEKKNNVEEALGYYNEAWGVSEYRDCGIGFRMAALYFKTKDYFNAIATGKKVLAVNPSYPKIKEEVIEKARDLMKP